MSKTRKNESFAQIFKKIRSSGLFGTLVLLLLVLVGNFIVQGVLVIILKTSSPLHTPISRSMEPTLNIGDLLIIQGGLNADNIYVNPIDGDILIFHDPRNPTGIPIVHRAIDKYNVDGIWYIVTKGDNNALPDDWHIYFPRGGIYNKAGHPESYIIGRVIVVVPYVGYVLRVLDDTKIVVIGFEITLRTILIIILIAAFLILEFKGDNKRMIEPINEEDKQSLTNRYKSDLPNPL